MVQGNRSIVGCRVVVRLTRDYAEILEVTDEHQ